MTVVLDKLGGAIMNPDARFFEQRRPETNPVYLLRNLQTLAREGTHASPVTLRVARGSAVYQFVMGAQALKWDFIIAYLGGALESSWPATKWIGTGGTIVLGLFTPATGGYGSAFEYCDKPTTSAQAAQARNYILNMLETYDPAQFAVIAKRVDRGVKCADSMVQAMAH